MGLHMALEPLSFIPHPLGAQQLLSMALFHLYGAAPAPSLCRAPFPRPEPLEGQPREAARWDGAPGAGTGAAFSAGVTGDAGWRVHTNDPRVLFPLWPLCAAQKRPRAPGSARGEPAQHI